MIFGLSRGLKYCYQSYQACAILDFQVALCTKEAKYYPGILGIGQKDLFGYMYVQKYQYRVVYQKVDTFEHKIWVVITHNPLCDR